jgi:putative endonuclease
MKSHRQTLGRWGERLVETYLQEQGYSILERNARTPYGEIDLVTCTPPGNFERLVVFVEVKTRRSPAFGKPEQSVNSRKQEHLRNAALHYLQQRPELGDSWRIDVIAVERQGERPPAITHFENAFGEQE